ncbi:MULTISPECIES: YybS family protein [Clostridium]|uniref:YybS family protein n=1 Tax=Clostridium lapidicellarium TaxID=3240931 RepID=A0ABV4DXZ2_9CLOT|nr:YybS family protein [uncultured Clostridium sp.]
MQKSTYDTKALIEGSLTTAITVVMMLINVYVPVFSIFANFILPIPITLLYIKQNYKVTLISVIASGILMSIFYNPIFALSLIILTGLTGMTLGYCIKNKMKFSTTMVFLSIAMAVGIIFYFTVYIMFISKGGIYGFVNKIVEDFKQSMDLSKNMYEKAGVSSNQLSSMESMLKIFTPEYIMKLIPAVIIIMSFTLSYLNYIITRSILKKLKYQMNESKPLGQWYMNTRVGTLVGLILVIGILFNRRNMAAGQYLVASSKIILELIFFIDGIALLTYYLLKKFKISKKIIAVIIILTALSSLSLFYVLAGFIDMIFDFRKLDPYRKSGKK